MKTKGASVSFTSRNPKSTPTVALNFLTSAKGAHGLWLKHWHVRKPVNYDDSFVLS